MSYDHWKTTEPEEYFDGDQEAEDRDYEANARYDYVREAYSGLDADYEAACDAAWDAEDEAAERAEWVAEYGPYVAPPLPSLRELLDDDLPF